MTDFEELIDRYFTSLNETDDMWRRELIEKVWAENGKFISPIGEVQGCVAIDVQIQSFQRQFPGAEVRRTSEIEALHDKYVRFAFEAVKSDEVTFIRGIDFAVIAGGKLQLVAGFFDLAPNMANQ